MQEELIKLCFVKDLNVRTLIFENLDRNWITIKQIEELYDIIYIHLKSEHPPNPSIILNEIKDSKERGFLSGILFDLDDIKTSTSMAKECLIRLEKHFLKNKLDKLRETLRSQTSDEINLTMKEISTVDNHLQNITTKYNDIKKS